MFSLVSITKIIGFGARASNPHEPMTVNNYREVCTKGRVGVDSYRIVRDSSEAFICNNDEAKNKEETTFL